MHVYLILLAVETPTYIWWNLPITIVIRLASKWLHFLLFMDALANLHLAELNLVIV